MRIGINGRFLIARKTGVQRVAYNLIDTIIATDFTNEYIIFTGEITISESWQRPKVTIVKSRISANTPLRNHLWEQVLLPRLARRYNVDILHNPANIGPLFYRGISIINIHDLCFLVNPSWYSFSFRTLYQTIVPKVARNATHLITNSNNSKNDIYRYLDCDAEKVTLIYWAVEDIFLRYGDFVDKTFAYRDYILYVGSVEPRKNISRLLRSYEKLRNEHPEIKTKLIIIGCSNRVFRDERFKIHRYGSDVVFQGYVSDVELINFYAHASVCIYPSLYEGFGLPPLEAMACETPVITSSTSSLPEVVADAAITIDPTSITEMTTAMLRILDDQALAQALIEKGRQRAALFSWNRAACSTIALYDQVFYRFVLNHNPDLYRKVFC